MGYFKEKPEVCFNNKIFEYYEKENTDITSKWIKIDAENSKNCKFFMRSVIYDNENFKLLGINSNDGQIYEKSLTNSFSYNNWDGPINKDIPMKKIMFDKHDFLIGIGLLDNYELDLDRLVLKLVEEMIRIKCSKYYSDIKKDYTNFVSINFTKFTKNL